VSVAPTVVVEVQGQAATVTWAGLTNGATGAAQPYLAWTQASFQVSGTFGSGGSIKLQGSNDGSNWFDLSPTPLTSAGFFGGLGANEKPLYVRPNVTAGDATTSLTVVAWFN